MQNTYTDSLQPSKIIYFTKARTALRYGLKSLGLGKSDAILMPDFICESVFEPIFQNSMSVIVYETELDLRPNWSSMEASINKNTKAVLMVHYFGQPQDINKFQEFAKKHNLYLIEDNAHGHAGKLNNKLLGTYGDIGISSPRKFQGTGGILYLNKNYDKNVMPLLDYDAAETKVSWPRRLINENSKFKHQLKLLFRNREKYEDPRSFRELEGEEHYLADSSIRIIESLDWTKIAELRRKKYFKIQSSVVKQGLKPVFKTIEIGSNPWCFPAYASTQTEAIKWFDWGWKNNIEVYSWPVLREEQLCEENSAYSKWKKLVCFSLL
jgi:perosamine synthetase